jgi:hypothetical protein|tara:strand:- start:736 stop:1824 length:1089 start_codon:yes stop_codon:yes gene_type:complete
MTVTIASTTDADEQVAQLNEAENTETPPSEMSSPQADGVPSDEMPESSDGERDDITVSEEPQEEIEAVAESEEEPVEATADSEEEQEAVAEDAPKKKRGRRRGRSYKERASQLAREKAAEKGRADELERRLIAMEQRERQSPPSDDTQEIPREEVAQAVPTTASTQGQEQPVSDKPDQESYDTYEEFQEALIGWNVGQRMQAVESDRRASIEREQDQQHHDALVATHYGRIDAYRDGGPSDFDAVIQSGKDLPLTAPMRDTVLSSESGPALMYYLSKNPEECDRIANMHPMVQIKELGKLEARIEGVTQAGPSSSPEPVTRAPRPIKPVGGGATIPTVKLDDLPYQEFKAAREKQLAARYGR